jgi:hypothetical protein
MSGSRFNDNNDENEEQERQDEEDKQSDSSSESSSGSSASQETDEHAGETTVLNADMQLEPPGAFAVGTLVRKATGDNILIDKPVYRIGKNENYNDYCIRNNPAVSRMHAEIHATQQGAAIVDCGSTNGTFVCGNRIPARQEVPIHPGNVITLGDEEFEFRN